MKKFLTIITLILILVSFSFSGIEWTSEITTQGKKKKDNNKITSHVYAQKGFLKQVFETIDKENQFYTKEGYWLFKANENNVYIVNDKDKTYQELSLDVILQLTGMFGKLFKIKILNHTIHSEKLNRESVEGYSCNHMKLTTDYTMKMKIAIIKKTVIVNEVKEIWSIPNLKSFNEINNTFLKKDIKTGIPELDELIKKQIEEQGKIGFPVKVITHTIQKSKKGKITKDTITTMKISNIKFKNFSKSFFEIPGDYQIIE